MCFSTEKQKSFKKQTRVFLQRNEFHCEQLKLILLRKENKIIIIFLNKILFSMNFITLLPLTWLLF